MVRTRNFVRHELAEIILPGRSGNLVPFLCPVVDLESPIDQLFFYNLARGFHEVIEKSPRKFLVF